MSNSKVKTVHGHDDSYFKSESMKLTTKMVKKTQFIRCILNRKNTKNIF